MGIPATTAFMGCPSSLIVSGNSYALTPNINVYSNNGNYFQQLVRSQGIVKNLDCSTNYLASLDVGGNLQLTSYTSSSPISSTLAGGIIALIVICTILIAIAIAVIVWFCIKARKMELSGGLNTTKELMQDKQQMY